MKLKVSPKDMKLLLLLLALVILAGSYFFVYQKNMEKKALLEEEDIKLEEQVQVLKDKVAKKQEVIKDTNKKQADSKKIIKVFPSKMTTEKGIAILDSFEKINDFYISEESFAMNELMYQKEDGDNIEESEDGQSNYMGYRSNITVSFESPYEALKEVMKQINSFPNRMTVDTMTLSYDSETGNLKGTMVINCYSLKGTDKAYEPPIIPGIDFGVFNLFRSKRG